MDKPLVFRHEAMATEWELFLTPRPDAASLARDAFADLDRLESELTRFRPDSDIGRIQSLRAGETTRVGAAAMDCLLLARDVHAATGGAFDVTIGPLLQCWRWATDQGREPGKAELSAAAESCGMTRLLLEPESLRVGVAADHMVVDLGGVGKGYAADQMAMLLLSAGPGISFMLNAGSSTVLAAGPGPEGEGWPVRAGSATDPIFLRDASISGSGTAVKGRHILDPRTRRPTPVRRRQVWVKAQQAAVSDAFATAFLVLSPEAGRDVVARYPELEIL